MLYTVGIYVCLCPILPDPASVKIRVSESTVPCNFNGEITAAENNIISVLVLKRYHTRKVNWNLKTVSNQLSTTYLFTATAMEEPVRKT
jgi:hypothetical protein